MQTCLCGTWPHDVLRHSVVSHSLRPHGLQPTRLLCPWDSPGKNTGVGCHALFQGIFPTQQLNGGLLNCRRILYQLSYQGSQWPLDLGVNPGWRQAGCPAQGHGCSRRKAASQHLLGSRGSVTLRPFPPARSLRGDTDAQGPAMQTGCLMLDTTATGVSMHHGDLMQKKMTCSSFSFVTLHPTY